MKTKFNPKDVPDWCKWIAVDEDGVCCAFRKKPYQEASYPTLKGYWNINDVIENENAVDLYKGKPPKNWKDELYTWGY